MPTSSASGLLKRLKPLQTGPGQVADSKDGHRFERFLVKAEGTYPHVVVQREYAAGSGRNAAPLREFSYVADHVLVRPASDESASSFLARIKSLGFTEPEPLGRTGIYRLPLASVELESVDQALLRLGNSSGQVAEPDFMVFSDEIVEATMPLNESGLRVIDPVTHDWVPLPGEKTVHPSYAPEVLKQQGMDILSSFPPGSRVLQFEGDNVPNDFRPGVLIQNFWTRTVNSSIYSSVYIQNAYTSGYPVNGSNYVRVMDSDEGLDFFHKDGLPFDVHSIDISEYSTLFAYPKSVTFTGTKADGSMVSQTFTTDGVMDGTGPKGDFQTFTFSSSFTNLVNLRAGNPSYMMDNIVVTLSGQETPLPPPPAAPVIYDVDWDDPLIALNSAPPVCGPYAVSSIPYGRPLIRSAVGALTSRPLELMGDGQASYGQVRFDLARNAAKYIVEFDLVKTNPSKALVFFFDGSPGLTRVEFNASTITNWTSGGNTAPTINYNPALANRIRLEMDFITRRWKLYLNGVLGFDSSYTGPMMDMRAVRFSLGDAEGTGGAAIDNFRVEAIQSSSAPVAQPRIGIFPAQALVFPSLAVGGEVVRSVNLQNSGTQNLQVTSITSSNPAFKPDPGSIPPIAPGGTYYHNIKFKPEAGGLASGQLTIASNDPATPSLSISMEGTATGVPGAVLEPGLLDAKIVAGAQGSESFTIRNTGSASLEWRFIRADGMTGSPPAPLATNDPSLGQLWGLGISENAGINAVRAWQTTSGSSSILAAVIDTGVDLTHPDLISNLKSNSGEIPGNNVDDDNNGYVDDVRGWNFSGHNNNPDDQRGHGTHVAGTIAASGNNNLGVVGVAWSAQILPVQFLSSLGVGYTSDAIEAVHYARSRGARLINASWGGGGYSTLLHDAISQFTVQQNGLFVAAAGNSSADSDLSRSYPAGYDLPGIVAVAATDSSDRLAYFSNFGRTSVDVAAPGSSILSCYYDGGYAYASGTSMAAPHVTGALALLLAKSPSLPSLDQKELLLDYVDYPSDLSGKTLSGGRVNIWRSLERIMASWLSPLSTVGSVAPGSSSVVALGVDAASLAPGEYTTSLAFQTNDPLRSTLALPVRLRVLPNTAYNQWTSQNFGQNGLLHTDSSLSTWALDADPDKDGLANILEYVFSRSASISEPSSPIQMGMEPSGSPYASFQVRIDAAGVVWVVEWSSDLAAGSWQTGGLVVEEVSRNNAAGTKILKARFQSGESIPSRAFFRIRASAND